MFPSTACGTFEMKGEVQCQTSCFPRYHGLYQMTLATADRATGVPQTHRKLTSSLCRVKG